MDNYTKRLENALLLLLDQIDYTAGACAPTEMVAAVVPTQVLQHVRDALASKTKQKSSHCSMCEAGVPHTKEYCEKR